MVTRESGPGWIFRKLRRQVKEKAPKATHMDDGIACLLCMSAQIGLAVSAAQVFLGSYVWYQAVIAGLAFSAAAIIVSRFHPATR